MFSVIIPMAGSGVRTGLQVNKALYKIDEKPIFMFAFETFKKFDCEIILVCKEEDLSEVKKYAKGAKVIIGGSSRSKSVLNGIKAATNDLILIHDAARPFVTEDIINNTLASMQNNKCAYVGVKVVDTIRDVDGNVLDRDRLISVQTPQAGFKDDFIKAFELAGNDNLTDDVMYLSKYLGYKPVLVEGSRLNFKITTFDDILMAKSLWEESNV